jgi:beta-1,2-mannobiose phosphorylase / 1,2-beta-oligomannan phosphorylase
MFLMLCLTACRNRQNENSKLFPDELVKFTPYEHNPVFTGTDTDTWDRKIRERGYILYEDGLYKMWYTGYKPGEEETKKLGYAVSEDGIHWTRYKDNPVYDGYWTEDVFVVHYNGKYYMTAEGRNDIAHFLISEDGINWTNVGDLDIRKVNGEPIDSGAYGTPTLWIENGKWYLFYEREDKAIWLAVSTDHKVWTNIQDEPVIVPGPAAYDAHAVALDQVIKYKNRYYAYYHASPDENWSSWNSDVAVSVDLIHWTKFDKNPVEGPDSLHRDISSPIVVWDGKQYRLYTMHDGARAYFPN